MDDDELLDHLHKLTPVGFAAWKAGYLDAGNSTANKALAGVRKVLGYSYPNSGAVTV